MSPVTSVWQSTQHFTPNHNIMTVHVPFNSAFINGELLSKVHLVRNPAFTQSHPAIPIPLWLARILPTSPCDTQTSSFPRFNYSFTRHFMRGNPSSSHTISPSSEFTHSTWFLFFAEENEKSKLSNEVADNADGLNFLDAILHCPQASPLGGDTEALTCSTRLNSLQIVDWWAVGGRS